MMHRPSVCWVLAAATLALTAVAGAPPSRAADEPPRALIERGAFKQARALLEPRLQAHPDDAEALWLMSRVKQAFGDTKAALDLAERAVALDGKNAEYHLQVAEVCGQMGQKAGLLKGMSLGKRFKKEAEIAVALDPRQTEARMDLMMFYVIAPGIVGGDKKRAKAMAEEIMGIDPVQGNLAHARLAIQQKDSARAEPFYRQAVEIGAKNYRARLSAASFYIGSSQRKWELAESHATTALELDRARIGAYVMLAAIYAHGERWPELDALLAAAEASVPDDLSPHYQAARILIVEGRDPVRAERYLRKYLSAEPEGGAPGLGGAHWRLGQALERQGRTAEAKREIEAALKINPDLDEAKKDLKRLRRA